VKPPRAGSKSAKTAKADAEKGERVPSEARDERGYSDEIGDDGLPIDPRHPFNQAKKRRRPPAPRGWSPPSHWNDPLIRQLGEQFATEPHDLADGLYSCGADASQLLLPWRERNPDRADFRIPAALADALEALCLSLRRPGEQRRRGPKRKWSLSNVRDLIENEEMTLYAAAKKEAKRSGQPAETIERGTRDFYAATGKKPPKSKKLPPK
jgi:hypothetical protein